MLKLRIALLFAVSTLALPVAACGGGSGGGPAKTPVTLSVTSTPTLDGGVFSNGQAHPDIYPQPGHGPGSPSVLQRGIYHFSIAGVPAGAEIVTATLHLEQFLATTPDAYAQMGPLLADHIDMTGLATLTGGLFAGNTISSGFVTVATNKNPALFNVDVTARVAADVAAGRTSSGYRLRFQNEAGAVPPDNASTFFTDGEPNNPSASLPTLVVTYR